MVSAGPSGAPGSGSDGGADAGRRRLQALVRPGTAECHASCPSGSVSLRLLAPPDGVDTSVPGALRQG